MYSPYTYPRRKELDSCARIAVFLPVASISTLFLPWGTAQKQSSLGKAVLV